MSLEKVFLILDVDGVTRRGVSDIADPKVMEQINRILACPHFQKGESKLAFVSGSQVLSGAADLEEWRGANVGLMDVFKPFLPVPLFASGKCSAYGQLGADRIVVNNDTNELEGKLADGFSIDCCVSGMEIIISSFLNDCKSVAEERGIDAALIEEAYALLEKTVNDKGWESIAKESQYLTKTPDIMAPLAHFIREKIDNQFRFIFNGSTMEYHGAVTEMPTPLVGKSKTCTTVPQVAARITEGVKGVKALHDCVAEVSVGIAHRNEVQFRYAVLLLTTKGRTVSGFKKQYPEHTFITVGDGHVDYSMHRIANFSFHVGPKSVWETEREKQATRIDVLTHEEKSELELKSPGSTGGVKHVAMITCGSEGQKDMQLTDGTATVLSALHSVLDDAQIVASEKHIDQVFKILGPKLNYE